MDVLKIIALIVGAYLIGNINFAVIISKLRGGDIRKMGSGNPGTINMLRNFGTKMAIFTLLLDTVKGVIPALVGLFVLGDRVGVYIAGVSVVVGHMFPVFMRFKGGKGVATSIGVFLVSELWWVAVTAFVVSMLYLIFFHYGFVASMMVLYTMLFVEIFAGSHSVMFEPVRVVLICTIVALVTLAHRKNFVRLIKGKESKVYAFGIGKPKESQVKQAEIEQNEQGEQPEKQVNEGAE